MKILGIDEAGRGPVLGSMFIGGVLVDADDRDTLQNLGLKDSKDLSDTQREQFVPQIEDLAADTHVKEVTADDIDELRQIMSLNAIEINGFTTVIKAVEPDKVYIDLPEPDGDRFVKKIKNELPDRYSDVAMVAEHKADENYPIVSAAAILAKSARESHCADLQEKYGVDFDTGYPHDDKTIAFLKDQLRKNGEMPAETRMSWNTAQRLKKEHEQQGLHDF